MLFTFRLLLLPIILLLTAIGPGLPVAARLRWKPKETLCAAVALSLFFSYLAAFVIYALHLPNSLYYAITIAGAVATFVARDRIRQLLRDSQVRAQLWIYLALFAYALCAMATIRHYSGGLWAGDWIEHYQRVRFFLDHEPLDRKFIDVYSLPSRPPMMNVLVASWMAQVGDNSFAMFQVAFLLLNLLVVVSCVLFLAMLGARRWPVAAVVLAFLFAANPMFIQNLMWTWTKLLSAFYVMLGLWLYLRGWQKQDSRRTIGAFVSLAIGTLVHYSTGPYIVVLFIHYGLTFLRRRKKNWKEPIIAGVISAVVLFTWLGWSASKFGWHETLASNTSVAVAGKSAGGGAIGRILANVYDTLIPIQWRDPDSFSRNFPQPNVLGYVRDYAFCLYQHNLILGMGSLAGVVITVLTLRAISGRQLPSRRAVFWRWFIVGVTVLGVAVVATRELLGVAHICLQAMMLLGVTLLAANFERLGRPLRVI
ncbi:MAG TPA: DUF6541 family protein, partial [Tepidisphaeraceae bacterium]|nr:DUF6541 family protein [Tepidisphaeraceae bacterium]